MLDKEIEFHKILMKRPAGGKVVRYNLPDGYRFVMFKKGDDRKWADIESSVGEFPDKRKALKYFRGKYLKYTDELERRCIFIEANSGKKIATLTIWWEYISDRRYPWVSWVAVRPGTASRA